MKNAMQWCKVHHEARTDPKLKILTLAERGVWMNLLLFASEQQQRGTIDASDRYVLALECADGDESTLNSTIEKLMRVRHLISEDDGIHLAFRTWIDRQYDKPSDTPEATRERKERSRHAMSRDVTPIHALEEEGEIDPEKEGNKKQTTENTWQIDHPPTHARVVEATPPPLDDVATLAKQVQEAANLYSRAMVGLVEEMAPAAAVKGINLVSQAREWAEKNNTLGRTVTTASFRSWLEKLLNPDRTTPPKSNRKLTRLERSDPVTATLPPVRAGPADTPTTLPRSLTRVRDIAS